jgi:hypothetical protein
MFFCLHRKLTVNGKGNVFNVLKRQTVKICEGTEMKYQIFLSSTALPLGTETPIFIAQRPGWGSVGLDAVIKGKFLPLSGIKKPVCQLVVSNY